MKLCHHIKLIFLKIFQPIYAIIKYADSKKYVMEDVWLTA